jgi:hypothetical protein
MTIHLEQAVVEAIADLLARNLPSLNAALRADTLLATLPQPLYDVTASDILIADAMDVWKITDSRVRILVAPGHFRTGQIFSSTRAYIDGTGGSGYQRNFATDVAFHFHPDLFSVANHVAQSQQRVRAQMLVAGWLDWDVFNSNLASDLRLTSDEYNNSQGGRLLEPAFYLQAQSTPYPFAGLPQTDHLLLCMASGISRGVAQLGFAGTQTCYCVTATHSGSIS